MPAANVYNMDGEIVREFELDDYVFGAPVNTAVLHQVVTAQLVNRRQGNASTKTRAHVSGGNNKPYRQKGTGRARQGSRRAPHFKGGGVVFGPHPHSYERAIPRKMKRVAIRSALSDRAAEGRILVMDELAFERPRTRDMEVFLDKLPLERHVLALLPERDENVILSARNIHRIKVGNVSSINVVEILKYDHLILPVGAVERIIELFGRDADDRLQMRRHPRLVYRKQQRRERAAAQGIDSAAIGSSRQRDKIEGRAAALARRARQRAEANESSSQGSEEA